MFGITEFFKALTPERKIVGLRVALLFMVFLFVLMLFYRFIDLRVQADVNKVTINTQSDVIQTQKDNQKGAGEAAVAIVEVQRDAAKAEVKRQLRESAVVGKRQAEVNAGIASAPLFNTPTPTENDLSQVRIDWLWEKYCAAIQNKDTQCVR